LAQQRESAQWRIINEPYGIFTKLHRGAEKNLVNPVNPACPVNFFHYLRGRGVFIIKLYKLAKWVISLERTDTLHKSYIERGLHPSSEPVVFTIKASVLFYEPLYTSSHGLKDDYPWSGLTAKTPRLLNYLTGVKKTKQKFINPKIIFP
jgi:hypothetical protein